MSYEQPPLHRGIHPLKMNWLWRLICEVGYVAVEDIVSALHGAGIPVTRERAQGWLKSEGDEDYFPLTIAELEQNLRVLRTVRSSSLHPGLSDSPDD